MSNNRGLSYVIPLNRPSGRDVDDGGLEPGTRASIARRHLIQKVAFGLLWVAGFTAVGVVLAIILYVVLRGGRVVDLEFLTTPPQGGLSDVGGISTTIVSTVYLVFWVIAIAAPLGVMAAIFLVEYAEEMRGGVGMVPFLVQIIRFAVELLGGVPSIIFGLFGYALFVSAQAMGWGFSLLSAAVTGACLVLPVIIRASEEAIRAVPDSYRRGSLALGATKWQTVCKVVLPAAAPGIVTGIVLSVGRVVSETAVFFVTFGGTTRAPESLFDLGSPGRSMALHVYYLAMETRAFDKAMGTGAILIATIVLINLTINIISRRLTVKLKGN
ncbi:MAG: phosphate ABC transporter permease PstA [Anaerolineales bacterium]